MVIKVTSAAPAIAWEMIESTSFFCPPERTRRSFGTC